MLECGLRVADLFYLGLCAERGARPDRIPGRHVHRHCRFPADRADAARRFEPRPRSGTDRRARIDERNIRHELQRIRYRCESFIHTGHASFAESAPQDHVASMVVIRLALLLELPEFAVHAEKLTADDITAIKATRSIAAHAGCLGMNDIPLWSAVSIRIPEIVTRLLDSESP